MVSTQYGYDLFVSDTEKCKIPVTDTVDEAAIGTEPYDNIKLEYWRGYSGYDLEKRYVE